MNWAAVFRKLKMNENDRREVSSWRSATFGLKIIWPVAWVNSSWNLYMENSANMDLTKSFSILRHF